MVDIAALHHDYPTHAWAPFATWANDTFTETAR
jgi:hypothetical protein